MMPAPPPSLRLAGLFLVAALLLTGGLAPRAAALGQYDGTYGGTVTIVRNNARIGSGEPLCSVTAVRGAFQVVDSTILLVWNGSDWRVPIRTDGSISSSTSLGAAFVSASGKVTGNAMMLFFGTQACGYRFEGFRGG